MPDKPATGGGSGVDLSQPKNLASKPLRYNDGKTAKQERVARWQRILKAKGYLPASFVPNGLYRLPTLNATRSAARANKVGFQGTITPGLWDAVAGGRKAPVPPKVLPDPNVAGVAWLERNIGPKEQTAKNDGPWLRVQYSDGGDTDVWFASSAHAPYCARIGVDEAFEEAGIDLLRLYPTVNWNFCPTIEACIRSGKLSSDGKWRWVEVAKVSARRGDVMLHGKPGGVSTHVSRASGSANGGLIRTTGANTPPGLEGDQSGLGSGDGIWTKTYDLGTFRCCGRLVPVP